jgi:hypothetical protein
MEENDDEEGEGTKGEACTDKEDELGGVVVEEEGTGTEGGLTTVWGIAGAMLLAVGVFGGGRDTAS